MLKTIAADFKIPITTISDVINGRSYVRRAEDLPKKRLFVAPSMAGYIRPSGTHWRELSHLLSEFERCLEACSRLDAYRAVSKDVSENHEGIRAINDRVERIRARIDTELRRVTAERLLAALPPAYVRERIEQLHHDQHTAAERDVRAAEGDPVAAGDDVVLQGAGRDR